MAPSAEVVLSLLAVRLLGGKGILKTAEVLKGFAKIIPQAIEQGWLEERSVHPLTRTGKPGKKAVQQLNLTEAGERLLRESAGPEAAAARRATDLSDLRRQLEEDRQTLREQVLAALPAKGKNGGESKLASELAALTNAVKGVADRLSKLEKAVGGDSAASFLASIDRAFAALTTRLEQLGRDQTSPVVPAAPTLRQTLRTAYDKFRHFVEYEDGLIDIPRLYHEARRTLPRLTPQEMHAELLALWQNRALELHVLNEVHRAAEPDLGIRHNDKLLYFVYWKQP